MIMYRNKTLLHHQYFAFPDWSGGMYATATLPGSRPGGLVAATWAALMLIGQNGYVECCRQIVKAAREISSGIAQIDGLRVLGNPQASVVSFTNDERSEKGRKLDVYQVSDGKRPSSSPFFWAFFCTIVPTCLRVMAMCTTGADGVGGAIVLFISCSNSHLAFTFYHLHITLSVDTITCTTSPHDISCVLDISCGSYIDLCVWC